MIPQRAPSPTPHHPLPQTLLPPGHFLSLPPSFSQPSTTHPSGHPTTSSHTSNGQAPNTSSLSAADFGVDVRTGFLPATTNLVRLPGEYEIWEEGLEAASGGGVRLERRGEGERSWRSGIEVMEILDIAGLDTLPLLQRAHLVLTFLLHFYAHTSPKNTTTPTRIPESISVPLMKISPLLGLPPILTYADTVLYNFHSLDPTVAPSLPSNPPTTALASFTGTKSEEQFYIISALCEIAGAKALRLMRQSLDELFLGDNLAIKRLTKYLKHLSTQIDIISDITATMITNIDPEEFYHLIRPWFKGGDADGDSSHGWGYMGLESGAEDVVWEAENKRCASESRVEGVKGRKFSGPSAGQSSLIHAIDVFLTVDHSARVERVSNGESGVGIENGDKTTEVKVKIELDSSPIYPSSSNSSPTPSPSSSTSPPKPTVVEATYLQRMLSYMPLPHRTFLLHLSTHPTPLRQLVLSRAKSHPKLAESYDGALEALKRFRERHMRVVSVFIVQQARREPSARIRRLLGQIVDDSEEEVEEMEKEKEVGELRGTGGTALFKFLKMCRDNTTRAMVSRKGASGYEFDRS